MHHSKPDLLIVLVMILGIGVLVTSYGSYFFQKGIQHTMTCMVSMVAR